MALGGVGTALGVFMYSQPAEGATNLLLTRYQGAFGWDRAAGWAPNLLNFAASQVLWMGYGEGAAMLTSWANNTPVQEEAGLTVVNQVGLATRSLLFNILGAYKSDWAVGEPRQMLLDKAFLSPVQSGVGIVVVPGAGPQPQPPQKGPF